MKTIALIIMLFCFGGCMILENLDEITTLGQYSREKDGQHREVKEVNDHYDALAQAITNGHIGDLKDQAAFAHAFGEPLIKKDLKGGSQRWLYRYAIYRLSKDKVYVYFDHEGKTVKWEKLQCQKFF